MKVVDVTEKIRAENSRQAQIEKLLLDKFPSKEFTIFSGPGFSGVFGKDHMFNYLRVNSYLPLVTLFSQRYLKQAEDFVRAYESLIGREVTLETDYSSE